jgi:hypothetical protein
MTITTKKKKIIFQTGEDNFIMDDGLKDIRKIMDSIAAIPNIFDKLKKCISLESDCQALNGVRNIIK